MLTLLILATSKSQSLFNLSSTEVSRATLKEYGNATRGKLLIFQSNLDYMTAGQLPPRPSQNLQLEIAWP